METNQDEEQESQSSDSSDILDGACWKKTNFVQNAPLILLKYSSTASTLLQSATLLIHWSLLGRVLQVIHCHSDPW